MKLAAAAAVLAVMILTAVGFGSAAATARAGADGESDAPGYAQTDACKLLSAHLAASILGGPTRIDPTATGRGNGASSCSRKRGSNYVTYTRSTFEALKSIVAKEGVHSISELIDKLRQRAVASCKNISAVSPHATTGSGVSVLTYPKEVANDAVLCVENPGTPAEQSELFWTVGQTYYSVRANFGEDPETVAPRTALVVARQLQLLPGE